MDNKQLADYERDILDLSEYFAHYCGGKEIPLGVGIAGAIRMAAGLSGIARFDKKSLLELCEYYYDSANDFSKRKGN